MRGVSHGAFMAVRPIVLWPHTPTRYRQRAAFSAGWTATRSLLIREAQMLGATSLVLQLAVTEDDIRLDGEIRANARPAHPGVIVSFVSRHGPLEYSTDVFERWHDNVRAIALGLEALRKVDRYGIARRGEQYSGWRQLPAGDTGDVDEDLVEKGRGIVENQYGGNLREARRATHPDVGGTHERFIAVQAYAEALAETAR
jgi:hypothetical protein